MVGDALGDPEVMAGLTVVVPPVLGALEGPEVRSDLGPDGGANLGQTVGAAVADLESLLD